MGYKQNQKPSTILKYNKRRFDGGFEIEQIRQIESQQAVARLNRLYQEKQADTAQPCAPVSINPPVQPQAPKPARINKHLAAWIMGPLEICIGVVGILTSLLALFTFRQLNNAPMVQQSEHLLQDCVKTLKKGIIDTIIAPAKAIKALQA